MQRMIELKGRERRQAGRAKASVTLLSESLKRHISGL